MYSFHNRITASFEHAIESLKVVPLEEMSVQLDIPIDEVLQRSSDDLEHVPELVERAKSMAIEVRFFFFFFFFFIFRL